jgi:hypothetical protein
MDRLRELDTEHLLCERAKPGRGRSGPRRQMPLGIYRHRFCFDVMCWRERPLKGDFRGDGERRLMAVSRLIEMRSRSI